MTDDDMPDLKSETLGLETHGQEVAATPSVDRQLNDAPAEPPEMKVRVAILKLSVLRARALTEEEKAENHRRRKEIRAGRHPDTGQRLGPGDRKTLKPADLYEFQRFLDAKSMKYGASYLGDFARSIIEAQERRRAIEMSIRGTLVPELPYRATYQKELSAPALPDNLLTHDQVQRQPSLDASLRTMANELTCDRMAQIDRRQRFLDPPFPSRITGDASSGLLGGPTELRDSFALRSLQEEVSAAARTKIIEHWKIASPLSSITEAAAGFQQDINVMAREAERMLRIYGAPIVEQPQFLTEYHSNLALFQPRGLVAGGFEAADLLARIVLPIDLLPGFENYQVDRVERLRAYARAQLIELENDFRFEPNPVFVLEALCITRSFDVEVPEWVHDSLTNMAEGVLGIGEKEQNGRGASEAELVGKALGFSRGGKGQTGRFAHAKQVQRDRDICLRVDEWLSEQKLRKPKARIKVTRAYAEVAPEFGVDPSTIRRAYRRMKSYVRREDETES
jgi:hypothetical protein